MKELSARQNEVYRWLFTGLNYEQIGEKLFITEAGVKFHVTKILKYYGCKSRCDLVARAIEKGQKDEPRERN